jgi:hypothetical protein
MKTKLILIGITLLLLISLGIVGYITIKQRQHISDLRTEIQVKGDTISQFKDKNNLLVSRIGTYEKSLYELKHYSDSIEKKMLLEAKNNGIKDRRIKELSYLLIVSRDSLGAPVDTIRDSIVSTTTIPQIYHSAFSNGFLSADVYMVKDKMKLTYCYETEIYRTKHMVRPQSDCKFFRLLGISFKKKKEVVDYKLSDPNGSVLNVREIIIKK